MRLVWVDRQAARCEPIGKRRQNGMRLRCVLPQKGLAFRSAWSIVSSSDAARMMRR
jgi:hypothetical protein